MNTIFYLLTDFLISLENSVSVTLHMKHLCKCCSGFWSRMRRMVYMAVNPSVDPASAQTGQTTYYGNNRMLLRGLAGIQWHLSLKSCCSTEVFLDEGLSLCHPLLYTFPLHDPWMIQRATVFVANSHSFFMTALSWKPSPVLNHPAGSPLDFHHWWMKCHAGKFFFFLLFSLTCPDAWIHKLLAVALMGSLFSLMTFPYVASLF